MVKSVRERTSFLLIAFIFQLCNNPVKTEIFQLSKDVIPRRYQITLNPNLNEGIYHGKVRIEVNLEKPTNSVTLHSKNLTILDAKIDSNTTEIATNPEYDFLTLHSPSELEAGPHEIKLEFEGDMKNKKHGFFRAHEVENGKKTYFGVSLLEPINARVAFPCFDEPRFKARFSISLGKPPGYVALSNMNATGESFENGTNYVHFSETPLMSTYLLLFFVGNYSYVEDFYTKQNGEVIPVRVYSPHSKIKYARYGVRKLPLLLEVNRNYTGFECPLPKYDYITVNAEFHGPGGMENWGAITGRDNSVLFNEEFMSVLDRNQASNMGHEIGHNWFGNLVTTSSWGEFWLNEGFDRFMDITNRNLYEPEQSDDETSYVLSTIQDALWTDDDLTTKPLASPVKKYHDVFASINGLSYSKGGSVLKMAENVVGKATMQAAIREYIKKYAYKNVKSENFPDVLQSFVGFNANDFLMGFVNQSGYPLITVDFAENMTRVVLKQERFLRAGQFDQKTKWTIPVTYFTDLNKNPELVWFNKSQNSLILSFPKKIQWIKLNAAQIGYYRTNYPLSAWKKFTEIIHEFSVEDKSSLLDDSVALFRAGKLDCGTVFELLNQIKSEEDHAIWGTAYQGLQTIRYGLLQHNSTIDNLKRYVAELINEQYKRISWTEQKTFREKSVQANILNFACYYGHEGCKMKTEELWNSSKPVHIDIQNILWRNRPNFEPDYNRTYPDGLQGLLVHFVGVNASHLPVAPEFRWPKDLIQECKDWLHDWIVNNFKKAIA